MARSLVGKTLKGRYRILRELGRGAMGVVYLAEDHEGRRRRCALKSLRPELTHDAHFSKRFKVEADSLRQLRHPNIVPLLDLFVEDGLYCLVMPFVEDSLAAMIDREGPLGVQRSLALAKPLLRALDHAHQGGVIHRDVKPSNVLIDRNGQPLLCDFGIARRIGDPHLTRMGVVLGTPEYMSPEQVQGLELSHASDVYAAGVVLFEMLTGRPPFLTEQAGSKSDFSVQHQHVHRPPPDPRSFNPGIDEALAGIVLKALRKEPARRFQGCADFCSAIERYEQPGTGTDTEAPPLPQGRRTLVRRYQVYEHPTLGCAAVKQGFSWPALFANIGWMLFKGLYAHAARWLAAYLLLVALLVTGAAGSDELAALLGLLLLAGWLVLWLAPAFKGNQWRAGELARRGYRLKDTVAAATAAAAMALARSQR